MPTSCESAHCGAENRKVIAQNEQLKRERSIGSDLRSQLSAERFTVENLSARLADERAASVRLETELAARDRLITQLETQLAARDHLITQLESRIVQAEGLAAQQAHLNEDLLKHAEERDAHWRAVQQTLAWRLVLRLRAARQAIAPDQSRREHSSRRQREREYPQQPQADR